MSLVGLDFETANPQRNSACQIGLVLIEGGRLVDQLVSLIRPPGEFSPFNIDIHGITPSRVAQAPTMAALWPQVRAFLARGRRVVAHNAGFDRSVLVASLAHHGIDPPALQIECTLQLARLRLPHLDNHKLPTVCAALSIPFRNHHDALADATATAMVAWTLDAKARPAVVSTASRAGVRRR